jgi:hypothetical protein
LLCFRHFAHRWIVAPQSGQENRAAFMPAT